MQYKTLLLLLTLFMYLCFSANQTAAKTSDSQELQNEKPVKEGEK